MKSSMSTNASSANDHGRPSAAIFLDPSGHQQHFLQPSGPIGKHSPQQQIATDFRAAPLASFSPTSRTSVAADWGAQQQMTTAAAAAKFEPGTAAQLQLLPPSSAGIPPSGMLSAAATIGGGGGPFCSASSSSGSSSSIAAAAANPYWEWELAAMATMGRFGHHNGTAQQDAQLAAVHHQLSSSSAAAHQTPSSSSSAYYGQMAAAAAMSSAMSASAAGPAAAVWYPQAAAANYGCYYGLAAQRAGTAAAATLNGYLGAAGHYAGAYAASPAALDYYSAATTFPSSYYAVAALSGAAADPSKAAFMAAAHQYGQQQQQQYTSSLPVANIIHSNNTDLQSVVTGSELDSSPLEPQPRSGPSASPLLSSACAGHAQNGTTTAKAGGGKEKGPRHADKSSSSSSSRRSKKKKGAVRCSPAEPNNTRVFVWELEDCCSTLPVHHQCRPAMDQLMANALAKLLQLGFGLDHFEEFQEQANVEDAQLDEALQNAAANSTAAAAAEGGGTNFGDESGGMEGQPLEADPRGGGGGEEAAGMGQQNGGAGKAGGGTTGANEGLRRLAAKYRHIREVYESSRAHRLPELLDHCGINPTEFLTNMDHIERMPGANADLYRDCLRVISDRCPLLSHRCANIILSSNPAEAGVAGALGRLMLCRMGEYVRPENVFCTARTGKEAALERLSNQFQKKLIMLVTTSEETRQLANREGIPCWFLYSDADLAKFRAALDILVGDIPGLQTAADAGPTTAMPLFGGGGGGMDEPSKEHHQQHQPSTNFLQAVRG